MSQPSWVKKLRYQMHTHWNNINYTISASRRWVFADKASWYQRLFYSLRVLFGRAGAPKQVCSISFLDANFNCSIAEFFEDAAGVRATFIYNGAYVVKGTAFKSDILSDWLNKRVILDQIPQYDQLDNYILSSVLRGNDKRAPFYMHCMVSGQLY